MPAIEGSEEISKGTNEIREGWLNVSERAIKQTRKRKKEVNTEEEGDTVSLGSSSVDWGFEHSLSVLGGPGYESSRCL